MNIAVLADQLIEPISSHIAVALCVGIQAVIRARRMAINRHPEADCFSILGWPQDQMKIACMEAERDTCTAATR